MFKTTLPTAAASVAMLRRVCTPGADLRYRGSVAARVLAASLGAYALTSLATATLALLLPRLSVTTRAEAVLVASLWSFAIGAVIVMWVFTTRSARRAWLGLGITAAVLGPLLWWLRQSA
ncbi:DUF3649 domain-containing protein [Hydrogenophaga palleronii]|uniref:DUF3649 domain-containing protein n=1 Tax=Hydrogenophaga palleronii TaxID=65655 RepID=UPI000A72F201|nr:DUF3649 domain-containing protein [Hydrogenophaga palleronii]